MAGGPTTGRRDTAPPTTAPPAPTRSWTDVDDPQPTFTPVDDGPATDMPDRQCTDPQGDRRRAGGNRSGGRPGGRRPSPRPRDRGAPVLGHRIDPNTPLLGDSVGLRAGWQAAPAGFVDDPRAAVADAAELVERTAQTLIGSLQQRQRELRTQWDNNGSGGAGAVATGEGRTPSSCGA